MDQQENVIAKRLRGAEGILMAKQQTSTANRCSCAKECSPISCFCLTSYCEPGHMQDVSFKSNSNTLDQVLDDMLDKLSRVKEISIRFHKDLEERRASLYLKGRLLVEEQQDIIEKKLDDIDFRVKLLRELVTSPAMNYSLLATHVPEGKSRIRRKPCLNPNDVLNDSQKKNLVSIMVDMDVFIWQETLAINKAYQRRLDHQIDRNKFRSKRDGLWQTAVNKLQREHKEIMAQNTAHVADPVRKPKFNSLKSKCRPPKNGRRNESWYLKYEQVQDTLTHGAYLRDDFLLETRLVSDDSILSRAQQLSGRKWISTNRCPTASKVGLFEVQEKGQVVPLSEENEAVFSKYIGHLKTFSQHGKHFLGPFFCHQHDKSGYALHALRDVKEGEFLMYVGECRFEGDRRSCRVDDGEIDEDENELLLDNTQDDLYTLIHHISGEEAFECVIDPKHYSNFGRYIGGVSPSNLEDANCMPFVVCVDGFYHLMIVVTKDINPGDPLLYYYRGMAGEKDYGRIPAVAVPVQTSNQ